MRTEKEASSLKFLRIKSYEKLTTLKLLPTDRDSGLVLKFSTTNVFVKLRKVTVSAVMSVRMEQLGFHWTDCHEILYMRIFRKSDWKIQGSLKSCKNNGYLICRPLYVCDSNSLNSSWMGNVLDKICRENHKIHFMFSSFFFFWQNVPFLR